MGRAPLRSQRAWTAGVAGGSKVLLHGDILPFTVAALRSHAGRMTYRIEPGSIVLAVDGSEHAERATRWAADQAFLEGRRLVVMSAASTGGSWTLPVRSPALTWTPSKTAWKPPEPSRNAASHSQLGYIREASFSRRDLTGA